MRWSWVVGLVVVDVTKVLGQLWRPGTATLCKTIQR